jgi:hypothetical protein
MLAAVLTTIQQPTPSVQRLADKLRPLTAALFVAGDAKGPSEFSLPGAHFLSLSDQTELEFSLVRKLPTGHYARKNVAYLAAISKGAECIYETDDDNAPNATWAWRARIVIARRCTARPWANVYRMFTKEHIWPRGFPLERLSDPSTYELSDDAPLQSFVAPIQQGLADGSPDVDAVWRLTQDRDFKFTEAPGVWLPPGTWCPFNSQTTWWWPAAFPLLYLPSHCSFRMTDIWRSFVAQRCLWEMGFGLVFHAPEVYQDRNCHDLLKDFAEEVSGYLNNQRIVSALERLSLRRGEPEVCNNLLRCYEALVDLGAIPKEELTLLEAWVTDLRSCQTAPALPSGVSQDSAQALDATGEGTIPALL